MKSSRRSKIILVLLGILLKISYYNGAKGHGRLMDPPARNSAWRLGYPNPVDYNDNELYCGGYSVYWNENEGKCGVCGDPYNQDPKPHEAGGTFATGVITKHYQAGQVIDVEVELTANHHGHFEMYLCPNNDPTIEATQECFDKYPLYLEGTKEVKFVIPHDTDHKVIFRYQVILPRYLTCTQCVIQWTYYTGNMWGTCENGTEAVGCGKPELFRNCADVTIATSTTGFPPKPATRENPFLLYYRDSSLSNEELPLIVRHQVCRPTDDYKRIPGIDAWCQSNCLRYPPNCPSKICTCPDTCEPIGELAGKEGTTAYCLDKCLTYPMTKCPNDKCYCY